MKKATNTRSLIAALLIAASFAAGNGIQTLTTINAPVTITVTGGTK